jgi:hypothetical protein
MFEIRMKVAAIKSPRHAPPSARASSSAPPDTLIPA